MKKKANVVKRFLAWVLRKYVERGDNFSSKEELKRYPDEALLQAFNDLEQLRIKMEDLAQTIKGDDEKDYNLGLQSILTHLENVKEEAKSRSSLRVNELGGREYIVKASRKLGDKYRRVIAQILDIVSRVKKSRLISLPKAVSGANCGNCYYWRDTADENIGYCAQSEVSIFTTKHQLCNYWGHEDAVSALTKTKLNLEPDYRDLPPPTNEEEFKLNSGGGLIYKEEALKRAKHCDMLTLPNDQPGASCYNCRYSTSAGWCKNAKVNQPIYKDMLCNFWNHPEVKKG